MTASSTRPVTTFARFSRSAARALAWRLDLRAVALDLALDARAVLLHDALHAVAALTQLTLDAGAGLLDLALHAVASGSAAALEALDVALELTLGRLAGAERLGGLGHVLDEGVARHEGGADGDEDRALGVVLRLLERRALVQLTGGGGLLRSGAATTGVRSAGGSEAFLAAVDWVVVGLMTIDLLLRKRSA